MMGLVCQSWQVIHRIQICIFACLYTIIHGTPSLAVLPEVLKQVQTEHGAGPALDLGMKLIGNVATVSCFILSNVRGEASALAISQRLAVVPAQNGSYQKS